MVSAACFCHAAAIRALLELGADLEAEDKVCKTSAHLQHLPRSLTRLRAACRTAIRRWQSLLPTAGALTPSARWLSWALI